MIISVVKIKVINEPFSIKLNFFIKTCYLLLVILFFINREIESKRGRQI